MTKFCLSVDIQDVITCATFCDDRLKGLGVARGRISRFLIDLRRRHYNSRTTVRVCDEVRVLGCQTRHCILHNASRVLSAIAVFLV